MSDIPALLAMLLSFGGGYLVLTSEHPVPTTNLAAQMTSEPGAAFDAAARGDALPHVLAKKSGSFFYANIAVNGSPTRFLIDTGANMVVLRRSDAERANLPVLGEVELRTASGTVAASKSRIATLETHRRKMDDVDAVIMSDELQVSLFGTGALERLGPVTIDGDRLILAGE